LAKLTISFRFVSIVITTVNIKLYCMANNVSRYFYLIILTFLISSCAQKRLLETTGPAKDVDIVSATMPAKVISIRPGAERTRHYFHKLKHDKRVAVVANQTSLVHETHLVDTLLSEGINVVKVFSPEHGFRGIAEAGALINNQTDAKTGLPIISLYGNSKKPSPEDLEQIDIVIFDLQDVGARFYTYISTLTLVMEACAENNIPILVLDRPNPHGFYVDGPVLEPEYQSFVGMHPIPVVHGMTMAEYARMINGERWLKGEAQADLDWVECSGYTHKSYYSLPVRPSPNLPDMDAIYLYPSLCFFEGTHVSVGRGTDFPFTVIGHPWFKHGSFIFTPESKPEAVNPPHKSKKCYGYNLRDSAESIIQKPGIRLNWLLEMYQADSSKSTFFSSFFNKLAGNAELRQQIEAGFTEQQIKDSWQPGIQQFMEIRQKYLLYRDF
jgi:uncharacterized protein YbbC (DUF1343 family)